MKTEEENDELVTALPEKLPKPTYAPFFVAMGLGLIFWSIITSFILTIAGIITFTAGLTIWIINIFEENNDEDRTKP